MECVKAGEEEELRVAVIPVVEAAAEAVQPVLLIPNIAEATDGKNTRVMATTHP